MKNYEKTKYGVFVHYIIPGAIRADGSPAGSLEQAADGFDADGFAADLEAMAPEYLIITAWHYKIRPLYPSEVNDRWRPGNSPRRDLLGDIIDAVKARGISVILYTHPRDGHDLEGDERVNTGWGAGCHRDSLSGPNPDTFDYKKWNAYMGEMYSELMRRYASRIDGVFLDGEGPGMYYYSYPHSIPYENPVVNYGAIRRIIKSADPELPILQNYFGFKFNADFAMQEGYWSWQNSHLDSTALWPACGKALAFTPFGGWAADKPAGSDTAIMSPREMIRFTLFNASLTDGGGACWAFGPYCGGGWPGGVTDVMTRVGSEYRRLSEGIKGTRVSLSFPTESGDSIQSKKGIFFVTSGDEKYEYMHILDMPENGEIILPKAVDGATLANGRVISGKVIQKQTKREGADVIVISGEPDPTDTIIRYERSGGESAPVCEWINDTDPGIYYQGKWEYRNLWGETDGSACCNDHYGCCEFDSHLTRYRGDAMFTAFEGDFIEIYGNCGPDGGRADVLIDEMKVGEIDQKTSERGTKRLQFSSEYLGGGRHSLKLIVTGYKTFEFDALKITKRR